MDDDATIEDEAESETPGFHQTVDNRSFKLSTIIAMLTKQWMIFLILSILIGVYLWLNLSRRRRHRDSTSGLSARDRDSISGDHIQGGTRHDNIQATISRYDSMAQVRQRQQQQHDEQAKAYAEKLKLKEAQLQQERIENYSRNTVGSSGAPYTQPAPAPATLPRASQPNVYRQDTHNPLGGSGGGGWRRSSRRMGPGGG